MILFLVSLAWLSLLFLVARLGESRPSWRKLSTHPLIYGASLGVYATSWTFYGAVGFARLQGIDFIAVSMGPTLACLLIPAVFLPLLRVARRHQLATMADVFAFRFRSQAVGVAVTLVMLVGILPYLAVQVRAVAGTALALAPELDGRWVGLAFCALMLVFAMLFGARHAAVRERHPGLVMAIAFESLFKTVALVIAGIVAWNVVDAPSADQVEAMLTPARGSSFASVLLLSIAPAFLLPRQFHMAFTEAPDAEEGERALRSASWTFPLLLLIMNVPIPLILWAGEKLVPQGNGDLFVLLVARRVPVLEPIVWLGGVSAASAMIIVAALALSSMVMTHLVLPLRRGRVPDVYATLVRWRRWVIAALLLLAFLVFLSIEGNPTTSSRGGALASVGLVSFASVLQLVPGLVGVLFVRQMSRSAVLSGLIVGALAWLVLLALPLAGVVLVALPTWLTQDDALGINALVTFALNVLTVMAVSARVPSAPEELAAARLCRNEFESLESGNLPASLEGFVVRVARVLGSTAARIEVDRASERLAVAHGETSAVVLQRVSELLEANLSGLVGPVLARAALTTEDDDDEVPLATRLQLLEDEAQRGGRGAAEALRAWLSKVFASLPVGVCVVSESGEPVWWNDQWTSLAGVPTEATVPEAGALIREGRTLNVTEAPVSNGGPLPGGRVLVMEDLTSRRALEQTVAHQDRLASIGRLGAGVAHEIGNPLAGLLMVAQNLQREDEPQDVKERLGSIVEQGRRIDDIVKALVTFARGEQAGSRQPRLVVLETLVRDAVSLVSMTRKRTIDVTLEQGLVVNGVAGELMQVLVNLLSNAADASPEGAAVKVSGRRVGESIELVVADQGAGIPSEMQAQVFEPFFTTKEPGQGTGLGLSIAYSLISAHDGMIHIDSAPNAGTRMIIVLKSPLPSGGEG